jgi:hypothetical protein
MIEKDVGVTVMVGPKEAKYFRHHVECPGESRIRITVRPGFGCAALFTSSQHYFPTLTDHNWSLGYFEGEDETNFGVIDTVIDIDPYEDYMPMKFTRRPTDRELESF